jgi:hypothetical protein
MMKRKKSGIPAYMIWATMCLLLVAVSNSCKKDADNEIAVAFTAQASCQRSCFPWRG